MQANSRARTRHRRPTLQRLLWLLLVLVALAAAWRWTPLREVINLERVESWEASLQGDPAAPVIVAAAYVLGSLILVPVTLMTLATVVVFGLLPGYVYALVGCVLSGSITYALGRMLGRETVRRLAGSGVGTFAEAASRHGLMTVVAVRILPIAPFTIVNLVVGASGIRFRDFVGGTLIGMAPGLFGLVAFEFGLTRALRSDPLTALAILAGLTAFLLVGWILMRGRLARTRALTRYLPSDHDRHG